MSDHIIKQEVLKTDKKTDKKILLLKGLSCSNCAAKIEKKVSEIEGVTAAVVDFVSQKMILEVGDTDKTNEIVHKAITIAEDIEAGLKVIEENPNILSKYNKDNHTHDHEHSPDHDESFDRKEIIRLGIGLLFFLTGIIFNFNPVSELTIFLIAYILAGSEVIIKAAKNILKGQVFDENFLMAIATIGAFSIGEYAEGVAVMLFYQVGELVQSRAVQHSRNSISALLDIRPDFANLKVQDNINKVPPESVKIGDIVIIKPGERVPLDGIVVSGTSMLDTSAITGESVPRTVKAGEEILSGSINKHGLIEAEVTREFGESTVARILELVQNASSNKAPTEKFITKFARYYTPFVVYIALALAFIPPLVIEGASFSDWIYRALVFLVVSCPCALVISIPLGFFGGIGGASKAGILMKGSNYLEALNNVDTVVFDKTGTLTKGVFKVVKIYSVSNDISNEDLLEYAAYSENYSNHPIAQSILKAFGKKIDENSIKEYEEIAGYGINASVKGKQILSGNIKLMDKEGIEIPDITFENTASTVIHVAIEKKYAGYIIISDELKDDAKLAVKELRKIGVKKLVMFTGDSRAVAEKIAAELELDEVYYELLPHQKVEKLEMLEKRESRKGKLLFVGDGINDAPVLVRSDVGIAMGGLGSDAAIEAADIVIMTDEPSKIATAINISKRTKTIVWQNIFFAFAVKGIVLILGAGGLATMWEAVFADVGVAVIAVFNSMRVLHSKIS